jgi:ribonuclease P protein component
MRRVHRLKGSTEFARVYRSGTRVRTESVVAVALLDDEVTPQLGITCARKIGNAVVRNRAKRRLRAAARPFVSSLRGGARVVLQATPSSAGVEWEKLEDDLRAALTGAGVLRG